MKSSASELGLSNLFGNFVFKTPHYCHMTKINISLLDKDSVKELKACMLKNVFLKATCIFFSK